MIPIINKFEYTPLERVTLDNGERFYITPQGDKVSSVTTILGATGDKEALREWRERVGDKEADRVRDEATGLGSLMHTHLENYIQGIERPRGNNLVRKMAENMADQIIARGLVNVNEIWGIESPLYFPGLYAGTADLIAVHNGEPAICDYKTTKKMKTKESIVDYGCQLAAYAMAHNEIYGTNIKRGVIFMVARDLKFEEYVFEGPDFEQAIQNWLERLETFIAQAKAASQS